jgi:major membrane immunogen (membrane-anchored lipoprotein)
MKILDIKPVRELERYGSRLDDKETTGFLKKVISSQANNRVDADVITGATKTSDTYERLVNEILDEIKSRETTK